jgi:hypothetical protein
LKICSYAAAPCEHRPWRHGTSGRPCCRKAQAQLRACCLCGGIALTLTADSWFEAQWPLWFAGQVDGTQSMTIVEFLQGGGPAEVPTPELSMLTNSLICCSAQC